jgi:3-dehydroquinate dehydratase I
MSMTAPTKQPLPALTLVGVASRPEAIVRFAETAPASRAIDLVEARVDLYTPQSLDFCAEACARLEATGTPVLVTLRLDAERGGWTRPDAERLPLYREALAVVSVVDVEAASPLARDVTALARTAGRTSVVSHHDFARTPPLAELERIVSRCFAAGADIAKVATLVSGDADRDALFALLAHHGSRVCVIGMAARAPELRVQLATQGSRLAYGYLDAPTAPGQISAAEMDARLREVLPAYAARRAGVTA